MAGIHEAYRSRLSIRVLVALSILGLLVLGNTTSADMLSTRAANETRVARSGHATLPRRSEAGMTANVALPPGYRAYSSRVLPYTIGYPPGWTAKGSVWGSAKRPTGEFFDGDIFDRTLIGTIDVNAEDLPPRFLLSSQAYGDVAILDLQRARESGGYAFTARHLGTIAMDGTTAYLIDIIRGTGSDALQSTSASWVAHGRGWWIVLTTARRGGAHEAYVPVLETMLRTFRER